ncbi:hypothetical protein THAOC_30899, partial [Thalassiosira oceanica]
MHINIVKSANTAKNPTKARFPTAARDHGRLVMTVGTYRSDSGGPLQRQQSSGASKRREDSLSRSFRTVVSRVETWETKFVAPSSRQGSPFDRSVTEVQRAPAHCCRVTQYNTQNTQERSTGYSSTGAGALLESDTVTPEHPEHPREEHWGHGPATMSTPQPRVLTGLVAAALLPALASAILPTGAIDVYLPEVAASDAITIHASEGGFGPHLAPFASRHSHFTEAGSSGA